MREFIVISMSLDNLTGKGQEYLVDAEGNVRAKFLDGKMQSGTLAVPKGKTAPSNELEAILDIVKEQPHA